MAGNITGATFGFQDMHLHGSAFYDFLMLRKRFFVDTLAWNIPHNDAVELDQYDTPVSSYSVALLDGRVVAGARIMRFTDRWGTHGCMLQDAADGKLPGIPTDVLPQGRTFGEASECTRLVLSDTLPNSQVREEALALVVRGLVELAIGHGSHELVTLTVPAFRRSLRRLGYAVDQISAQYHSPLDGRTYAILRMPARHADRQGGDREIAALFPLPGRLGL
ncbi:acyl-homoserine-lactone synthase [Palleronia abyssalis]|uniref:Acyl-homoserine-lactone synthase n=1 Tax=Palleronia abyssalis TaxID=1501240 RepID=A0A2R8BZG4_9RHOB|nr:acyl-homoserine-lactone synthase [Palleronia abyssalis]SPJ25513.1 hypothetical protein PAA8504_03364 [Palleronia abyssalis]